MASAYPMAADNGGIAYGDDPPDGRWLPMRCDVPDMRERLFNGSIGLAEHFGASSPNAPAKGYSPEFQVAIPTYGALTWSVNSERSFVDTNTCLLVRQGEEFSETHPIRGVGHSAFIFTPKMDFLEEFLKSCKLGLEDFFEADVRTASAGAQLAASRIVRSETQTSTLEREELTIDFAREVARATPATPSGGSRVVERAKSILHDLDCEPLSLSWVAEQIGVTPIYLTQVFKRFEGIPLYRYQTFLRLNRALAELPKTESLTELALELGFSSHSHFTAVFRQQFGLTPSAYRSEMLGFRPLC